MNWSLAALIFSQQQLERSSTSESLLAFCLTQLVCESPSLVQYRNHFPRSTAVRDFAFEGIPGILKAVESRD